MAEAFVGLGSNVGDRRRHLGDAVIGLASLAEVLAVSSLYETAPIGGPAQDDFLNQVVVVTTSHSARRFLNGMKSLEKAAGRERAERYGPRTLDLDLLLFDKEVIDEPGLTVPHPRLTERRFVLEPLLEIRPDAELPDGTPLASCLEAVASQEVSRLPTSNE